MYLMAVCQPPGAQGTFSSAAGDGFQFVARDLLCIKPYMSDKENKIWSQSGGTCASQLS